MNIEVIKADLNAKRTEITTLLNATKAVAEAEKREWTQEEHDAIKAKVAEGHAIKARLERAQSDADLTFEIERMQGGPAPVAADPGPSAAQSRLSLGAGFVASEQYQQFIRANGHKVSGNWTSPAYEQQATVLDTSSGSGGPLILPDYQAGIVPLLFKRLVVADLIAPGTTTGNLISYMKETTFTNAAAPVAEAGTKPESTLVYAAATSAVRKIAHWIPVTEEMLEDFAQTASIIDARLRLGLQLTEEDQLLNGSGTPPALLGLMTLSGLTAAQARGADVNADAIFKQITTIATTVFVMPDGIVMNPANWQTVQLLKNAAGNYLGSGPWAPAQPAQLWGLPVAVTPSIVANTALVGAFRTCAQIFRKGGVRVESSNSHSTFFVENKVAIRAEERLALVSYRDAGFGKVTGLN